MANERPRKTTHKLTLTLSINDTECGAMKNRNCITTIENRSECAQCSNVQSLGNGWLYTDLLSGIIIARMPILDTHYMVHGIDKSQSSAL